MEGKALFKLTLVCLLVLIGWVNPSWASDVADRCQQLYNNGQYEQAFPVCSKAAEQGDAAAQNNLGWMYDIVQQDDAKAVKWYRKAAEQGYADAQNNLGWMYNIGEGVQQDYAEAAKWYRKAAEQGDADAQLWLGLMYHSGEGVRQDYAEAVKWYRKAAEQGVADAQYNLGWMYDSGEGVQQDYAEAVKWYRKAAEQGNARAQFNLAVMYASGHGVLQSSAAAADWYYKAGLSYLREGKKDDALRCVERTKGLKTELHLTVPNAFLADKLLAAIYGGGAANASAAQGEKSEVKQETVSFGTGWPVLGGFVVTNYHVVKGHEEFLLLCKDGQKIPAAIAAYDAANDLALLKVTEPRKLPPALLLATRPARVGEKVFTIGYPHPTLMGAEPKLTDGIINSLTGMGNDPRTYQISVPVQAGNSGGPLLNMRGEVVGIVTAKLSAAEVFKCTGDLPQNVNYAVKAPYLSVLLSSTPDAANIRELPSGKTDLPTLASRIEPSVMIVIAE
jgi:TPR repeat protein